MLSGGGQRSLWRDTTCEHGDYPKIPDEAGPNPRRSMNPIAERASFTKITYINCFSRQMFPGYSPQIPHRFAFIMFPRIRSSLRSDRWERSTEGVTINTSGLRRHEILLPASRCVV